jgi:Ca2+-binding EF-hand superfamily protein
MWRSLSCSAAMLAIFAGLLITAADKDGGQHQRRPGDLLYTLIEMSDCDEDCHGELQHIYDVLRKLDKNKDGKIDVDEHKVMRHQLIERRADDLIKELDTDKDGKISRTEAKGQLRKDFERIDVNKDGFIARQELIQAISEKPSINIRIPSPLPPTNTSQKQPDHP